VIIYFLSFIFVGFGLFDAPAEVRNHPYSEYFSRFSDILGRDSSVSVSLSF